MAVPDLCLSLQRQPHNCLKTARRKMEPCDMFMSHRPVWQTMAAAGRQDGATGLGRPQRAGKASGGEGRRAPHCRPGVPGARRPLAVLGRRVSAEADSASPTLRADARSEDPGT